MTPFKSVVTFLPVFLMSCWVSAPAQRLETDDKPGSIRSATEAAVGDAAGTVEEAAAAMIPETSVLEKVKLDPAAALELLGIIDLDAVDKGKYVASIELWNPLKPSFSGKQRNKADGRVLFGVRRPYYRLDEKVRIIGSFDLRATGTLAGLGNSATLTFRYDFRGDMESQAFKVSMLIDQISYRITIAFGKPSY